MKASEAEQSTAELAIQDRRVWDPRKWKWTTRRVAIGMVVIAAVGGIVDALSWAQTWMPNVVVGALTVAITVTVVERALSTDREEAQRRHNKPITDVIQTRLEMQLQGFGYALLHDYSTTHLETNTPIPNTLVEMCDRWLDGTEDTPRPSRPAGAMPFVVEEARLLANHLDRVRATYAFVVERSPILVSAIERLSEWVSLAVSEFGRDKTAAPELRVTPAFEKVLALRIVESTKNLFQVLATELDYAPDIGDEQREAAENWNRTGRELALRRQRESGGDPQLS